MLVELYTASGWRCEVESSNPTFATFFEPYQELGEALPSRMELTGAVAEIIEEEWESYRQLISLMDSSNRYPSGKTMREVSCDTCEAIALVAMTRGEDCLLPPPQVPRLEAISRLSRILQLPEGWEKYASVDDETPEEIRRGHLLAQGRAMMAVREGMSAANFLRGNYGMDIDGMAMRYLFDMANEERTRLSRSIKDPGSREEAHKHVDVIFYGVSRNAALRASRDGRLEWTHVLWQDITPLLCRHFKRTVRSSLNTAELMAGTYEGHSEKGLQYGLYLNGSSDWYCIPQIRLLCSRILLTLPDDTDPLILGMGRLLGDLRHTRCVRLFELPGRINELIIDKYMEGRRIDASISKHYLPIVKLLGKLIAGREGLRRILLSLLHWLSVTEEHPVLPLVEELATVIEEYLESDWVDEGHEEGEYDEVFTRALKSITKQ
jgi:hypothetical protein